MHDRQAAALMERIQELERAYHGTFALCVRALRSDAVWRLREDAALPCASTIKLFVLIELFRQARAGRLDLEEQATWRADQWRTGDGVLRIMQPGQMLSLINLAILMMTVSDNVATAVLVERLGVEAITRNAHDLGFLDTNLHAGLPGGADAAAMPEPVTSARDLCALMTALYRETILTPDDCREIVRIMRANRCSNDMLPRHLPLGEDWGDAAEWIANKTGYGPCRVEAGLVGLRDRPFALGVFFRPDDPPPILHTKCLADYPPVLAMAEACRAIYEPLLEHRSTISVCGLSSAV